MYLFWGSQERFDSFGRGRGLNGRDVEIGSVGMVTDRLAVLCNRQSHTQTDVRGRPLRSWSANSSGSPVQPQNFYSSSSASRRSSTHHDSRNGSPNASPRIGRRATYTGTGNSRATSPTPSISSSVRSSSVRRGEPSPRVWRSMEGGQASLYQRSRAHSVSKERSQSASRGRSKSAQRGRIDGRRYSLDVAAAANQNADGLTLDGLYVAFRWVERFIFLIGFHFEYLMFRSF